MRSTCQFTYRTSRGRNRIVSISEPSAGLNAAMAEIVGGLILEANPFDAETGNLVSLAGVQLVTVSAQVIVPPPAAA